MIDFTEKLRYFMLLLISPKKRRSFSPTINFTKKSSADITDPQRNNFAILLSPEKFSVKIKFKNYKYLSF